MWKCSTFPGTFEIPDMTYSQKLRASNGQNRLCREIEQKIATEGPGGKVGKYPVISKYFLYPAVWFMNLN